MQRTEAGDGGEVELAMRGCTRYTISNAPFGQKLMHLPQRMHLPLSISGSEWMSFWVIAPLGQTSIDGHL